MGAIRRLAVALSALGMALAMTLPLLGLLLRDEGEPASPRGYVAAEEADYLVLEQTWSAVMPHETLYCADETLPRGTRRVLREGRNGELLRTASVTYLDGVEIQRNLRSERVRIQPVTEIVAFGSAIPEAPAEEPLPVISDGTITLPTGEVLTYDGVITSLATAYCDKGKTATGTQARVGAIAVDPRVIPYGTRMFIMSVDGEYIYGIATAEDCGSKEHIYGTRIDLHMDTYYECRQFGARACLVFFLS